MESRAKLFGLLHAASNVAAIACCAAVWWLRYDAATRVAAPAVFGVEVVALLLGATGGWLGGELVDRLGVGVDNGANLTAPNPISGRSAKAA